MSAAAAQEGEGRSSLREGFLASAARTPDAPALFVKGKTLSYGQLDSAARAWAAAIVGALGRPAQRVGVFAYRDEEAYVGVLAALYSGAAFVPLNRNFPAGRTAFMVGNAELDAVIVDAGSATQLEEVLGASGARPPVLFPANDSRGLSVAGARVLSGGEIASCAPLHSLPPLVPEDIAYILFTSGSTGEPKGVSVSHANVLHFIGVYSRMFGITGDDRFSQTFDQTFDPSVGDLFGAWLNGACVYSMQPIDLLVPDRFVRKHELTIWCSVPSVPALMRRKNLLRAASMPTLRWSVFGGEALSPDIVQEWRNAAPNSKVVNMYGPTELTIACFAYTWNGEASLPLCSLGSVPIGRPLEGNIAVIVDDNLRVAQPGEAGELLVSGPQTAPGYWKDPEKTRERFVGLDVEGLEGRRFYRTGDRVVRLDTGDCVYLGRVDYQIKVTGHRVELGEIEAVLRRVARVDQAVALGWPLSGGGADGIVAFLACPQRDTEEIRAAVRAVVPEYMVPKEIQFVEHMPVASTGKIDRKALLERLKSRSGGQSG